MNIRLAPKLNSRERKALKRCIVDENEKYEKDVEAMMVWVLHKYYGFGLKRLLTFRGYFIKEFKHMKSYYESDDLYPVHCKLKEMGYDIDSLMETDKRNN